MSESRPRIVIVGVGNMLMKDEGIGIHALKALQEAGLPPDVATVDGGTVPDLVGYTRAGDKLIIIDAAQAGGEPGTIYRFRPEDLQDDASNVVSAHEIGVPQTLRLMAMTDDAPAETVIIGVEPKEVAPGIELTEELERKMPDIVRVVLREITPGEPTQA